VRNEYIVVDSKSLMFNAFDKFEVVCEDLQPNNFGVYTA